MKELEKYLRRRAIYLAGINLFLWICIGLVVAAGTIETNGWLLIFTAYLGNFTVIVWNIAKITKEVNE